MPSSWEGIFQPKKPRPWPMTRLGLSQFPFTPRGARQSEAESEGFKAGHRGSRCTEASPTTRPPLCPPTLETAMEASSSEISWEYTQASQGEGKVSPHPTATPDSAAAPKVRSLQKRSARARTPGSWGTPGLEVGRWKFRSLLCHVPWATYLTSLNFYLVFSSERRCHNFQARRTVRLWKCLPSSQGENLLPSLPSP